MKNDYNHTGFTSELSAWLLNRGSDRYNKMTDKRKQELFYNLSGRVLEIGPGAGANLKYYPDDISWIGLEPNPYMRNYLKENATKLGKLIKVINGDAKAIPLEDESVDAVVSTLVLCSVDDVEQSLKEIQRILKPGGTFLFMEHVAARKGTFLRKTQRWIKPLWKRMADGCRPDQETKEAIEEAGFDAVNIENFHLSLPVVSPQIMGRAVKR